MNPRLDRDFWSGKRVAVTGGHGFLGLQIMKRLISLGSDARSVSLEPRADHPIRRLGVRMVAADVRDGTAVADALRECDIVFHTAASVVVHGEGLKILGAVHGDGTRNVLAATRGTRLVHTSSVVAVGATRDGSSLTEDSPFTLGLSGVDYVRAKRAAEEAALDAASRQDVVVVNPGYLLGPDDHDGSVMGRLCLRFWKGRVPVTLPGGLNLVDVRDVADGHLLAAQYGQTGRRYILGGENLRFGAFFHLLAGAADLRPRAMPTIPTWLLPVAARIAERQAGGRKEPYPSKQLAAMCGHCWFADSGRATHELGYRARPVVESLADAYRWHTNAMPIRLRAAERWWMRPRAAA